MVRSAPSPPSIMILTALVILILAISASSNDALRVGFYEYSCPQAEDVIYQTVSGDHLFDPSIAAGLLRLHFHDCFVHGCDASILLDATPSM
ncbi:Peroxidase 66 [Acorus calamus]|uniref:Peroxidase 66 n=1 Tax=Acorus calamus TaxID=4465 RepID=A0AAV9DDR4_ACOCL|nr:Peroxidase 66 [Acorus calamus]